MKERPADTGPGAAVPMLRVFDEAAARDFYLRYLGFSVLFEHRATPDAPLYLALRRGGCEVHLTEHHGDATPGSAARIRVADVDALCAELAARGHRGQRPVPADMTWGTRDMVLCDPFGNRLIFWQGPRA